MSQKNLRNSSIHTQLIDNNFALQKRHFILLTWKTFVEKN